LFAVLLLVVFTAAAQNKPDRAAPKFSTAVAFDTSSPVRDLAKAKKAFSSSVVLEIRPERGPVVQDKGFSGAAAVQTSSQTPAATPSCCTTNLPIAGSCRSSPPVVSPTQRVRSGTASQSQPRATRPARTTATRSRRGTSSSSRITRSTGSGPIHT